MDELVSVIVAMYNSSKFIEKTVSCLVSQTYKTVEIILVDDGSTDGTFELVQSLARANENIRCYRKVNEGVASTRNYGIERATGRYIAFCDHDDLWKQKKLECQMLLFGEDAHVGLVYSQVRFIDKQGKVIKDSVPDMLYEGDVFRQLLSRNFIPFSSVVVRKSCFDLLGKFRENRQMHGSDDRNMWTRIATRFKVRCCSEVLVDIVKHGQNYSDQEAKMLAAGLQGLDDVWKCFPEIKERNTHLFRKSYSDIYRDYGVSFFTQGDYGSARSCMLAAARAEPWRISTYKYLLLSLMPKRFVDCVRVVRRKILERVNCQRDYPVS